MKWLIKIFRKLFRIKKEKELTILREKILQNGDRRVYFSNGVTQTYLKNNNGIYTSIPNNLLSKKNFWNF